MFDFNENNEVLGDFTQHVILAGLSTGEDINDSMDELEGLAKAVGAEVLGRIIQVREHPEVRTYFGKGKVEELAEACEIMGADTVIFNNELSGMQLRNLEEKIGVTVLDRTILILDIFARRAVSNEGKLQIELAQLKYRLPRLTGLGKSLSRIRGGIGTRGPGEKKLETDRRHIQSRIDEIKREIKEVHKSRVTRRSRREKNEIPVVSLVGYTNAGKSALMNAILKRTSKESKSVFEENMLFATLDISQRNIKLDSKREFILIDTVGFVSKLPHYLIESFKSTLEEVLYSDLIVHVVDASAEDCNFDITVTNTVLKEIGADKLSSITVFNKIDKINNYDNLPRVEDESFYISATEGIELDSLLQAIEDEIFSDIKKAGLFIPYDKGAVTSWICDNCSVDKLEYQESGTYLEAYLRLADYNRLSCYIIK